MSSVTEGIVSAAAAATNRLLFEFTSVSDGLYDAFEFARRAITEPGVIISIKRANSILSACGRDAIRGQLRLIPEARKTRLTVEKKIDASKNLGEEWGELSRELCCALEFALFLIDDGVYDLTLLKAWELIQLCNGDRKKATSMYIDDIKADEHKIQARQNNNSHPENVDAELVDGGVNVQDTNVLPVVHSLWNMISGKHPAKGDDDESFPEKPSIDDWKMYRFVSKMMTPDMNKNHPLVIMKTGVPELTREFGWQLRAHHSYGDEIMDCFSMLLNLEQQTVKERKKTWFWSSTLSPLLIQNVQIIDELWAGKWNEMDTIAVPLHAFQLHYFLMVISFKFQKVYILDTRPFCVYDHLDVLQKIKFIHDCMNESFPEYRGSNDITHWPVVWPLKLSKQINSMDSGAYVCLFMDRLKDLFPTPGRRLLVYEDYIRTWVANRICMSDYNMYKPDLVNEFNTTSPVIWK